MKHYYLAATLLLAVPAHAQTTPPIDPDTKLVTYSEVTQTPGTSQTELYARAKLWFLSAFKSSKDVVQADEKEAGIVQGTGWRTVQVPIPTRNDSLSMRLWYTVKIAVKDGRYKYSISGFQNQFFPSSYSPSPDKFTAEAVLNNPKATAEARANQIKEINDAAAIVGASIKKGMSKPAAGSDF